MTCMSYHSCACVCERERERERERKTFISTPDSSASSLAFCVTSTPLTSRLVPSPCVHAGPVTSLSRRQRKCVHKRKNNGTGGGGGLCSQTGPPFRQPCCCHSQRRGLCLPWPRSPRLPSVCGFPVFLSQFCRAQAATGANRYCVSFIPGLPDSTYLDL